MVFLISSGPIFSASCLSDVFDEVSLDPGDVLVIEGIFLAVVCGDGFSDEGEVAVFDAFGEDFLFKDFGVRFDEFGLSRREQL